MTVHEFLANEIKEEVISRLSGSSPLTERIHAQYPSKQIIVGTLSEYDPEFLAKTKSKNNSLAISFLCKRSGKIETEIIPRFSVYYRAKPTYDEIENAIDFDDVTDKAEMPKIWKRYDFEGGKEKLTLDSGPLSRSKRINLSSVADHVRSDSEVFTGGSQIPKEVLEDEEDYVSWIGKQHSLKPEVSWVCDLSVTRKPFGQKDKNLDIVFVRITNLSTSEKKRSFEPSLFNCSLCIDIVKGQLEEFVYEYDFEGFRETYKSYLRTVNCQAEYDPVQKRIETKGHAEFLQKKIVPTDTFPHSDKECKPGFLELSDQDTAKDTLGKMVEAMREFESQYAERSGNGSEKYNHLKGLYVENRTRFEKGVNTILENENAMKAFTLMNSAFAEACTYDSWRLFQIHFIVSCIPDVIDVDKGSGIVDVLHVATGGGKSEAYFGLVLFSAFYDRLTGKEFGVTAITKFPLRMLSVQQLQRIAKIFAYGERIRRREGLAGDPFSIAYYVGSTSDFPRNSIEIARKLDASVDQPGRIVAKCPYDDCNGEVILQISKQDRGIVHYCKSCKSVFRFYFTDEDAYRFAPTFIVSTVDKHAGFALQRRYRNLIGGSLCRCELGHGFIPEGDSCEVVIIDGGQETKCGSRGTPVETEFSTAPKLIIQDEMHLIREGFGTVDSHFETAIEETARRMAGHGFKNIAMTATVAGVSHQVMELYGKDERTVPGQSPEGYGIRDFFFKESLNDKSEVETQRIHIGLKPNNRDNQFACLLTLRHLANVLCHIKDNLTEYSSRSGYSESEIENALRDYECFLTYHNKKQDVHSMSYFLNAVVNSKLETVKIKRRVLTGEKDLEYIRETIGIVESHSTSQEQSFHATFATSVVSHGVDINRWNVMLFQGIPRSTSEYIQAFSRTGRKRTGISFVWFYPTRARDISFFRNFKDYHGVLEHKVEHVPISRFAPLGLDQTLTSIFSGSILNYLSHTEGKPLYKTNVVLEEVGKNIEQREVLIDFLKDAYDVVLSLRGNKEYEQRIPAMVEERLNHFERHLRTGGGEVNFFPRALKRSPNKYFRTQYGMRGIQDEVLLVPVHGDARVFVTFKRRS